MADKIVAKNKKAYHEYFIEEKYEAGLVLAGTEVKSIRQGKVNLKDSYVNINKGEAFVFNMHISPYEKYRPLKAQETSIKQEGNKKACRADCLEGLFAYTLKLIS